MTHEPFIITARLQSRPSVTRPVHLDGLLLAAREIERNGIDMEPLDCVAIEDGVYRASAGVMVVSGHTGASMTSVTRTRRIRLEGGDLQYLRCDEHSAPVERLIDWKSPHRPMMRSQPVVDGVVAFSWSVLGDRARVLELARRIRCIGASAGTGMGRVQAWETEECTASAEDVGWYGDGSPIRNLPAEVVRKRLGAIHHPGTSLVHDRCAPPYWDKTGAARVLVVAPRLTAMIASNAVARRMLSAA